MSDDVQQCNEEGFERMLAALSHGHNKIASVHESPEGEIHLIRSFMSPQGTSNRPTIAQLLEQLPRKRHASEMLSHAGVADDERNGAVYLAYVLAMLMLVELHNQASSDLSALDPVEWLLGDAATEPKDACMKHIPPMLRVFFVTLSLNRCRKDSLNGAFKTLDDSESHMRTRFAAMLPCFASLIKMNGRKGHLAKLGHFQVFVAMLLLLDKQGSTNSCIRQLRDLGVCAGQQQAQEVMTEAAGRLNLEYVFPPNEEGDVEAVGLTADNANLAKWGTMWSFIALTAILLGFSLPASTVILIIAGLRIADGCMPRPSLCMASAMSLNGLDDKIMADERRKYQVESLLATANTPVNPASSLSGSGGTSALKIGDAVKFNYLKHQFEGRIVAMAPPKCTVAFKYKKW